MKIHRSGPEGFALIGTLVMIVIVTILLVGFAVSMRTERMASAAMAGNERAKIITQNAIEHATALLDNNIPQPVPPGQAPKPQNWMINPGLLTKFSGPDGSAVTQIPLSSNSGLAAPTTDFVNLNAKTFSGDYPIIPTGQALPASWVYVLQDPSQPASATNPIVGRYAFWMDDESAKINLNMAYGKPPAAKIDLSKVNPLQQVTDLSLYGTTDTDPDTDPHAAAPDDPTGGDPNYHTKGDNVDPTVENSPPPKIVASQMANAVGTYPRPRYFPLWHPSAINLDVLGSSLDRNALADWIYNDKTTTSQYNKTVGAPLYRLLSSTDQLKQFVTANPEAFYQQNKIFLTTSSRDPEFNVFGKSRIFLERRFPDMGNPPYLNRDFDRPFPNQPIFFQNDYDAAGPTYFHGYENIDLKNAHGIQHVADSISDLLDRNDWPGMPQMSFVDKWNGGTTGRLEADQVAWNIAMMGQYAAGGYDRILGGSGRDTGWMEGMEPISNWMLRYVDPSDAAGTTNWPAKQVRKGKLSQKAIVPYLPRPLLNEIAFTITAEPPDAPAAGQPNPIGYPPTYNASQPYRLKVTAQLEFYLPKKVPLVHIKGQYAQKFVLTHLDYIATGTDQNGQPVTASQTANGYSVGNGVGRLNATLQSETAGATLAVRPGSYKVVASDLPNPPPKAPNARHFYIRNDLAGASTNGTNLSESTTAGTKTTAPTFFQGTVTISGHLRAVIYTQNSTAVLQLIPVWDNADGSPAMAAPGGASDRVPFNFKIDLAALGTYIQNGQSITRSIQIADARLGGLANQWTMTQANDGDLDGDSLRAENPATTEAASTLNADEEAYFDSQNYFYSESPRGSIGMLASIPTGMQRGLIGETLKFQPSGVTTEVPDWVLLDLLCPSMWPNTYLNSTLGKVNINATIYPNLGVQRWVPLQAVFQNMRPDTTVTGGTTSLNAGDASTVVQNILNHTLATGGHDFGAQNRYDYIGELCEIAGVADTGATNWDKEALIRNLANILTTKSNTFCVWGAAQAVKKKPGNTNYGSFESGDIVTGEKRFRAIVDRYVWPGRDGVPGNGHTTSGGSYDSLASPPTDPTARLPWDAPAVPGATPAAGAVWAVIDGSDGPTYTTTSGASFGQWAAVQDHTSPSTLMKNADNPVRALMKYRVISLDYSQ